MAYPDDPLSVTVEFWDGTSWVDITQYVLVRDGISIRRGFPDEGTTPEPSSCTLTLNNRDGRFTPRNPMSPYYGLIGRNTPVRVKVDESFVASGDQIRFVGEISEWPTRWDVSGQDVWTSVTAQGILRRLGQGSVLTSSIHRWWLSQGASTAPIAYWPLDDRYGAQTAATPVPGASAGRIPTRGHVEFHNGYAPFGAADSAHLVTGDPVGLTYSNNQPALLLPIPNHTPGELVFSFWFAGLPFSETSGADGSADSLVSIVNWINFGSGTIGSLRVRFVEALPGTFPLESYVAVDMFTGTNVSGTGLTEINTNPAGPQLFDGDWHQVQVRLSQNGANIDMALYLDGVLYDSATEAGQTLGVATEIKLGPEGSISNAAAATVTGTAVFDVSSVMIHNDLTVDPTDLYEAGTAHAGETAGARAARLCAEAGISFTLVGDAADTMAMGAEPKAASFIDAYNETWKADVTPFAFETRDELGLTWRTRRSLYNQAVAFTLDYEGAGEVAPDLEPIDDDLNVRNDVTVKRTRDGATARAVLETGALSVLDPPDGVGRVDDERELNHDDGVNLESVASWLRHVGTVDEARYRAVRIDMAALAAQGKTSLMADVAALDVGDRFVITNPPAWLPPQTIDLLAGGFVEEIGHPVAWTIEIT